MIPAKDLRIGNLYKGASRGNIEIATGQTIAQIEEGKLNALPIELTPEILIAAGFRLQPKKISIYIKGRIKLWLGHNGVIAYLKNEDTDESYFIPNNPQSLHQLQNLYHSLTGEELKIELPTTGK